MGAGDPRMKQVRYAFFCLVAVFVPTTVLALVFGLTTRVDLLNGWHFVGLVLSVLFAYLMGKLAVASLKWKA